MENIDDFMQRKFDSDEPVERFPFREEYWEQAQALIEADEQRRRKKRRFLFWWLFSGLLLGAGALWLRQDGTPQQQAVSMGTSTGQPNGAAPVAIPDKNTLQEVGSDMNSAERSLSNSVRKSSESADNKQVSVISDRPEIVGKNQKSDKKTQATPAPKNEKDPTTIATRNAQLTQLNTAGKHLNTPNLSGTNAKIPNAATAATADKQPVKQSVETPALQTNSAINLAGANSDQVVDKKAEKVAWLDVLNLPFLPAILENKALYLKKMPVLQPEEIKPVSDKRFVGQAGASVSSWKAGWGSTAGVFGRYKLHGPWSIGAGLNLRYQPLAPPTGEPDSSIVNVTVQYRYSFGLERTEWRSTTRGLYYLELPLAAHWQRGRLGLEAGVAPGMLLLARNQVTETVETSLGGIETGATHRTWGEKAAYNKVYFNTFAMVEWRLVPHVSLTLRGHYRPGSILKPAENTTPEKGFRGLDLGARWQF